MRQPNVEEVFWGFRPIKRLIIDRTGHTFEIPGRPRIGTYPSISLRIRRLEDNDGIELRIGTPDRNAEVKHTVLPGSFGQSNRFHAIASPLVTT